MAVVQLRHDTEGRRYYRRKLAAGETPMEAMRCLKRRLSDVVYRRMVNDAIRLGTGLRGHRGSVCAIQRGWPNPTASPSEMSLPGPASTQPRTPTGTRT